MKYRLSSVVRIEKFNNDKHIGDVYFFEGLTGVEDRNQDRVYDAEMKASQMMNEDDK